MNTKTKLKTVEKDLPVVVDNATSMLAMIGNMASSPEVDIDKVERLMALQFQMRDRENEAAFNMVMSEVQSEIGVVTKNKHNDQTNSKYADLGAIIEAITPVYTKKGLNLSFDSGKENEGIIPIICYVSACGHTRTYHYDSPITDKGIKGTTMMTQAHARGSAVSYGRRYLQCMIFNIATIDDDGNQASSNVPLITEEQANSIHSRIDDNDLGMERFIKWLKASLKVATIEDINVNGYGIVDSMLDAQIKAQK